MAPGFQTAVGRGESRWARVQPAARGVACTTGSATRGASSWLHAPQALLHILQQASLRRGAGVSTVSTTGAYTAGSATAKPSSCCCSRAPVRRFRQSLARMQRSRRLICHLHRSCRCHWLSCLIAFQGGHDHRTAATLRRRLPSTFSFAVAAPSTFGVSLAICSPSLAAKNLAFPWQPTWLSGLTRLAWRTFATWLVRRCRLRLVEFGYRGALNCGPWPCPALLTRTFLQSSRSARSSWSILHCAACDLHAACFARHAACAYRGGVS